VCSRCIRACDDLQTTHALSIDGRGFASRIIAGADEAFMDSDCVSCGACVNECPVGALEEKELRTSGNPDKWVRTTCGFCGVGCQFDAGIIWSDGVLCNDMCGHGTIALGMAMVAHGMVPEAPEGNTKIRLETTAGLVVAEVCSNENSVEWTRLENVPAYVAAQDIPVTLPEFGEVKVDVAFGGNYFATVPWNGKNLRVGPENGKQFRELGRLVREQVAEKVTISHPTHSHIRYPSDNTDLLVTFWHEPDHPTSKYRNVHVLSAGLLDRSPGGTGTSAMMAMFEARGDMKVGETIQSEGLLGSGVFEGSLLRETKLGGERAVVPTVKGTAKVIGYAKWLLDPNDAVGQGFVVT